MNDPEGEIAVCGNCGHVKNEKTFQRDRCPKCNQNNVWKPIEQAREEMTAAKASDEHADFMRHAGMVLDTAVKLKAIMVKRGLGVAKAECPKCHVVGALRGRLITGPGAGRHRKSGGAFRMWCDTPDCGVAMME